MPEKAAGVPKTLNVEEIKKQRITELEREIQQGKQNIGVMVEDREKWRMQSTLVSTLQRQLGNNEFDPVTEKGKREQLAKYQGELKKIEGECYEKYKVQTVHGFGSAIHNYGLKIGRKEETLQILRGRLYVLGRQAGQSQQGQDDYRQQRVKGVAEPQAEYTTGKNNEAVESTDNQGKNQYTALKVTSFQSHREMFKQEYESNVQEEREQDRSPRGREM